MHYLQSGPLLPYHRTCLDVPIRPLLIDETRCQLFENDMDSLDCMIAPDAWLSYRTLRMHSGRTRKLERIVLNIPHDSVFESRRKYVPRMAEHTVPKLAVVRGLSLPLSLSLGPIYEARSP